MGEMNEMIAGPGQAIVTLNAPIPNPFDHYKFNGTQIEKKTQAEIDQLELDKRSFSPQRFLQRVNALPTNDAKISFLSKVLARLAVVIKESDIP